MVFSWMHLAILIFIAMGIFIAGAALASAFFVSPRARSPQMGMPYECGMVPFQGAWIRFHMNYAVYALIFLAFEVDVLYLFPVAVAYKETGGLYVFFEVFLFLFVLALAVVYFRAKGVFEWPRKI